MNYETGINGTESVSIWEDEDRRKSVKRRRIIIAIIAAVVLALGAGLIAMKMKSAKAGSSATASADSGDKAEQQQTVTVVAPGVTTAVRAINATGTLAARREIPVGVVGEGGLVAHVYADAGDWVKQGQVLVSIDRSVQSQTAAASEAQLGVSRADLELAQNELDRALQLVDRGFISKADVDKKTATRNSARARLNVATAQLSELRARNARLDIRAPVSGYVLERTVQQGQTVSAGAGILFRIAKDGEMELQAQLGEDDLAAISVGVPASVKPVGADQQFNGSVWQISPMIDKASRQGIARIALAFNKALRPGGFASVEIKAGATTAPILPESAIQNDKDGSFVYIIGNDGKVARRAIKAGPVSEKGIAILQGLDGTEKVVLYAGGFLNPGETVKVKLQTPASQ